MATPVQTQVTITAHQSHWYDIVAAILKAVSAANPILATFVPAPIEAGIQIATSVGPAVLQAAAQPPQQ